MKEGYSILERIIRIVIVIVVVMLITVGLTIWVAALPGGALANQRFLGRLAEQALAYGLLAAGMGLVMVSDEADLSVSGAASLAAIVAAVLLVNNRAPTAVALMAALGVGFLIGLVNGVLIGLLRLPFYVVTLATLGVGTGLSAILSGAKGLTLPGQPFGGSLVVLIVLNLIIYGLGVGVLFLLGRFTSLRWLRSLGARAEAEGQPSARALILYKIGAYAVSGLLAAGAGLALLNLFRFAIPGGFGDLTFAAIAIVIIGGAPLWKGCTRLLGALLGSLPVILLNNAVNWTQSNAQVRVPPALVLAALTLVTLLLWRLVGWALDCLFQRKPEAPEAQPTTQ